MTATHQDLPLSGYSGVAAASATARPSSSETRRGRTVESGRHRGRRREGRPRPPRLSFHAILTSLSTNTEAALHDLQHMDCLRETTFGKNKGLKFIIYFCQSKPHKEKNKLFRSDKHVKKKIHQSEFLTLTRSVVGDAFIFYPLSARNHSQARAAQLRGRRQAVLRGVRLPAIKRE